MPTDLAALSAAAEEARDSLHPATVLPVISKARWAYLKALEREHRTGNLVQIDREGMRERVATKLANADLVPPDDPDEYWFFLADAAIAAIWGGEHDK